MYKFEVTGVFEDWRIDKQIIIAKNEKSAKKKFRNSYKKRYRKSVHFIRVNYCYGKV